METNQINPSKMVSFAKQLGHNEQKIRDKALLLVEDFLRSKGEIKLPALDLLKLWKALYYCLWMTDKPIIQIDLATKLSKLIHIYKESPKLAYRFISYFWRIMVREWNLLDGFRLDKFYSLMRFVIRESLQYGKDRKWDKISWQSFSNVMKDEILDPKKTKNRGIVIHVLDIFWEEVEKVHDGWLGELSSELIMKFIGPFLRYLAQVEQEEDIEIVKSFFVKFLDRLLRKHSSKLKQSNSPIPEKVVSLIEQISTKLFDIASSKVGVLDENRDYIYDLRKTYDSAFRGLSKETKKRKLSTDEDERKSKKAKLEEEVTEKNTESVDTE